MIKKNTNISLFTQKQDNKISNKPSWHRQALWTLLLVLQALKSASKAWRALCLNKLDTRPQYEKLSMHLRMVETCNSHLSSQGPTTCKILPRCRHDHISKVAIRGTCDSLKHVTEERQGMHAAQHLITKSFLWIADTMAPQWRIRHRLSETQPCSYSTSERMPFQVQWVEHNKPARHHLENPSCIPIIKFSQP